MMSLFASFDLNFFSFQYFMLFGFLLMIFNLVFTSSSLNLFVKKFFSMLNLFFYSLKPKSFTEFSVSMITTLFVFIFILNFSSVFPYSFSFTSQVSVVLFMSFGIWISFFIFKMTYNFKGFISHCIPEGTPIYLTWFLFLIELVSNFIRPVTLSVRLVANILAGHLLMILLSELALKIFLVSFLYMGLNLVELFVSLIQAYIFVTMITLYFSDVN